MPAWGVVYLPSWVYLPRGVPALGGVPAPGTYLSGGYLPRGVYLPGGVPAREVVYLPGWVYLPRGVPALGVPALGVYLPGGICPGLLPARGIPAQLGVPARGCACPDGGVPARLGVPAKGGTCPGTPSPPVNRMTDRCKNITVPRTSFAGGNKLTLLQRDILPKCIEHVQRDQKPVMGTWMDWQLRRKWNCRSVSGNCGSWKTIVKLTVSNHRI